MSIDLFINVVIAAVVGALVGAVICLFIVIPAIESRCVKRWLNRRMW